MLCWLERHDELTKLGTEFMHCAPERCLMPYLRRRLAGGYVTVDLDSPLAEHHMDLTSLEFGDDSFDVVLCSHVLEHIPDDAAALAELRRVLRPTGTVVLQHPIRRDRLTYEDPTVSDPEERLRHFGQDDHVRMYGTDFVDRVRNAGFAVEHLPAEDLIDEDTMVRLGLREPVWPEMSGSDIYVCAPRHNPISSDVP